MALLHHLLILSLTGFLYTVVSSTAVSYVSKKDETKAELIYDATKEITSATWKIDATAECTATPTTRDAGTCPAGITPAVTAQKTTLTIAKVATKDAVKYECTAATTPAPQEATAADYTANLAVVDGDLKCNISKEGSLDTEIKFTCNITYYDGSGTIKPATECTYKLGDGDAGTEDCAAKTDDTKECKDPVSNKIECSKSFCVKPKIVGELKVTCSAFKGATGTPANTKFEKTETVKIAKAGNSAGHVVAVWTMLLSCLLAAMWARP